MNEPITATSVVSDAHNNQVSLRVSLSIAIQQPNVDGNRRPQNCKHYGTLMDGGISRTGARRAANTAVRATRGRRERRCATRDVSRTAERRVPAAAARSPPRSRGGARWRRMRSAPAESPGISSRTSSRFAHALGEGVGRYQPLIAAMCPGCVQPVTGSHQTTPLSRKATISVGL